MTPDDQQPDRTERPGAPGEGAAAPVDELASALLDGALDPAEAASARQRPEVVARVADLEAVRAALRSVPAPDPAARERAVAAALAAFDDSGSISTVGSGGATGHATAGQAATRVPDEGRVAPLRTRRHAGLTRRWLGAAAAVALVVAGVAGVAVLGSDDSGRDDAEVASSGTSPESVTESDESGESPPSDSDAAAGGQTDSQVDEQLATPDAVARDLGDLGAFGTGAELVAHIAAITPESVPDDGASASPEAGTDTFEAAARSLGDLVDRCAGGLPPPLDAPDAGVRLRGRATVAGHRLDVVVVDVAGATRVVALDADCAVEVDQPLG